ncbi:MAG: hypothetical protein H6509_14230 [Bryobacterales bacterium]|nr:hypothetical protein [Acidobacteriota bacterium]MCB9385770.1 hypothetical protein [Bryobacterales bacterium]
MIRLILSTCLLTTAAIAQQPASTDDKKPKDKAAPRFVIEVPEDFGPCAAALLEAKPSEEAVIRKVQPREKKSDDKFVLAPMPSCDEASSAQPIIRIKRREPPR